MNAGAKSIKRLLVPAALLFLLAPGCYALHGDFDDDNDVSFDDFSVMTQAWLSAPGQPNWNRLCDISEPNDGIINFFDMAALAVDWSGTRSRAYLKLTIDHTKVAGILNDFPVLINQANIPDDFWNYCRPNGTDIYVTTAEAPNVKLSMELAALDVNDREMELWVKLPLLSDTNDTVLNLYYGGSSIIEVNSSDTWSNGFVMVQHMNQNPSGPPPKMLDSSPFLNDGITYGDMTLEDLVPGQIALADDLDGVDDAVDCGEDDSLNFTNAVFNEQDTNLYDIYSHQGVAADSDFIYTVDNRKIYKRRNYPPYDTIMFNPSLLSNIPGDPNKPNHFGDGAVCNGYLYVAAEFYNYCPVSHNTHSIMKIDTTDLSYVTYFDIDDGNHECAGVATDGNILYAVSYLDGSKIWMYDIYDGSYLGFIPLSECLFYVQGITYRVSEDKFYISVDGGAYNKNVVAVDKNGTVIEPVWGMNTAELEGLDYSQNQMFVIENDQTNLSHLHCLAPCAPPQGFTLSAWANPRDITAEHALIARYNYTLGKRQHYLLVQNNKWSFRLGAAGGYSSVEISTPASQWNFSYMAAVYRPCDRKMELYKNGVLKKSQNYTGCISSFNQPTYIGTLGNVDVAAPFNGVIDEVRIENVARSPDWITTCYNNQSDPRTFYSVELVVPGDD